MAKVFLRSDKFFERNILKFKINQKISRGIKIVKSVYNGTKLIEKMFQVLNTEKCMFFKEYFEFRNKSKKNCEVLGRGSCV